MTTRTPRDKTAIDVATFTGLTYRQVWRLARKGCIPCTIVGNPARMSMTPGQWDQLSREGVKPEPKPVKEEKATEEPTTTETPSFIRRVA